MVFGNVIHTEPKDMYLARVAAHQRRRAAGGAALTLNRLCGSGLQAIVSAAQTIMLGDADVAVGGGAESMSRAPYSGAGRALGRADGRRGMVDMMVGALHDPFDTVHMGDDGGERAPRGAKSRASEQDALAVEIAPPRRRTRSTKGHFKEQILPIELEDAARARRCSTPTNIRARRDGRRAWRSCVPCSARTAR